MKKKIIVWSGITLFGLTLVVAGCEKRDRDEGDERDTDEQVAPPSQKPGAVAPPAGETGPGGYGQTSPETKQ